MPTLQLIKMDSLAGGLYILKIVEMFGMGLMEDGASAGITRSVLFVFDLRRRHPACPKKRKYSGKRPVPAPPAFQIESARTDVLASLETEGKGQALQDQIYLINLTGGQGDVDIEEIRRLFPCAEVSSVSRGDPDWSPVSAEDDHPGMLDIIDAVEETEWTNLSERSIVGADLGIGPFEVFLFPATKQGKSASVLVAGEVSGRPFNFFLGNPIFKRVFHTDRVKDLKPMSRHLLSVGTWRAFYSATESKSLLPVKTIHGGIGA